MASYLLRMCLNFFDEIFQHFLSLEVRSVQTIKHHYKCPCFIRTQLTVRWQKYELQLRLEDEDKGHTIRHNNNLNAKSVLDFCVACVNCNLIALRDFRQKCLYRENTLMQKTKFFTRANDLWSSKTMLRQGSKRLLSSDCRGFSVGGLILTALFISLNCVKLKCSKINEDLSMGLIFSYFSIFLFFYCNQSSNNPFFTSQPTNPHVKCFIWSHWLMKFNLFWLNFFFVCQHSSSLFFYHSPHAHTQLNFIYKQFVFFFAHPHLLDDMHTSMKTLCVWL